MAAHLEHCGEQIEAHRRGQLMLELLQEAVDRYESAGAADASAVKGDNTFNSGNFVNKCMFRKYAARTCSAPLLVVLRTSRRARETRLRGLPARSAT